MSDLLGDENNSSTSEIHSMAFDPYSIDGEIVSVALKYHSVGAKINSVDLKINSMHLGD
ncbi:hypothetical protein [Marinifilum sp. D714]|uniref:hypothetical protein n=1 Tax=Marinifilum sp. D714 TaxID=2937523 RepID=UPI0027C9E39F|nr:hypothetical protein [Marinifilum sp. D714]MDQ2177083.1 hypothetical protein [Marinifilum sp. D714]